MEVRVRMAPSPTGYLHIGTARTALFNWLYAKRHGGKLILRIEDTDTARSTPEFEKDIIEQLKWLGIAWDEGPFRQSERLPLYEEGLKRLLAEGKAYWCACTKEELEAKRQEMLESGIAPRYSGTCRDKGLAEAPGRVIRFKMPERTISFADMIRGPIAFEGGSIGDIVIAKGLREPLYNFAVVVDDADMAITHVIRGEDGIANTPKQIALQEALGYRHPHYGHVPLILDADRSKMSKRNAATALGEYRTAGYLPEAMMNFLALLGWHPKDNREFLTIEELTAEFDIERVQKGGAAFSIDKLNWMNAHCLRAMDEGKLLGLAGWEDTEKNRKVLRLVKTRAQTISDLGVFARCFFELPAYEPSLLIWKTATKESTKISLERILPLVAQGDSAGIMKIAEGAGKGETLWPLRVALSGLKESPGPLEMMDALGTEEAAKRVTAAIAKCEN